MPEYQQLISSGGTVRFRPGYYVLRAFEIYAWGDNMRLWYLLRYLADIGTTLMVFSLFLRKFGLAAATTFVVLYLSHQGWSDLLPRLGPTEFYGNSIIVILVWLAWKYERGWIKNGPLGLIGIAASSFLFATLKEVNSVFLVEGAVLSILCGLLLNNPRLKTLGILCGAIGCAVFAFLILTVRKVSLPSGSLLDAVHFYFQFWTEDPSRIFGLAALVLIATQLLSDRSRELVQTKRLYALLLLVLALEPTRLMTYFLSNSIIVVDRFDPFSRRYSFPLVFIQAFTVALLIGQLTITNRIIVVRRADKPAVRLAPVLTAIIVAGVFLGNVGLFHPSALRSMREWQQFNQDGHEVIKTVARKLFDERKAGKSLSLFVSGPAPYWEPALALVLYLHVRLLDTPVYVDISEIPKEDQILYLYTVSLLQRYGATVVSGSDVDRLKAGGCIEAHADVKPLASSKCEVISVIKPF